MAVLRAREQMRPQRRMMTTTAALASKSLELEYGRHVQARRSWHGGGGGGGWKLTVSSASKGVGRILSLSLVLV